MRKWVAILKWWGMVAFPWLFILALHLLFVSNVGNSPLKEGIPYLTGLVVLMGVFALLLIVIGTAGITTGIWSEGEDNP